MALRKQPDRRVKKKRKLEMQENLDITQSKQKLEESKNFDIVGNLLRYYGMTGENLVREIFSYTNISSIQGGHLVSKTWNIFLINDRRLWMEILRQTQPYFKFLGNQLLKENISDDADRNFSKIYFDFVEKNEDDCCQNIIEIFKKVQMIHTVLQDLFKDCPVYHVFQKEFIGEKLAGEIQFQIDKALRAEKKNLQDKLLMLYDFESSFAWLLEKIANLKVCRDETRVQIEANKDVLLEFDQNDRNIYEKLLLAIKAETNAREQQLLLGIKIILRDNCIDADLQSID